MHRLRVMRHLASWQVAGPIVAYILVALLTVSVVEAFVARQEALSARDQTARAASRRIDLLQAQITRLQHRVTSDARERGRLEEIVRVLAQQIRAAGGKPVVVVTSLRSPAPRSGSSSPRPTPSPTSTPTPRPHPSPTPGCDLTHPLRCVHLP